MTLIYEKSRAVYLCYLAYSRMLGLRSRKGFDAMTDHDSGRGIENDPHWLQNELNEALKTIRTVRRQLNKELQRQAETERAQNLTISNLADAGREQLELRRERD